MNDKRKEVLIRLTRRQIIGALKDDLAGGELIMKEAWEECRNSDEQAVIEDELRNIINKIGE